MFFIHIFTGSSIYLLQSQKIAVFGTITWLCSSREYTHFCHNCDLKEQNCLVQALWMWIVSGFKLDTLCFKTDIFTTESQVSSLQNFMNPLTFVSCTNQDSYDSFEILCLCSFIYNISEHIHKYIIFIFSWLKTQIYYEQAFNHNV